MDPDSSRLDAEIEEVTHNIQLLTQQLSEEYSWLSHFQEKIKMNLENEPDHARKDAFFDEIKTETMVTEDYVNKINELVRLRKRHLELLKMKNELRFNIDSR